MWAKKAEESYRKREVTIVCKFIMKVTSCLLCHVILIRSKSLGSPHSRGRNYTTMCNIRSLGSLRTSHTLPAMTTAHMLFGSFILMNSENYDRWVGEESCWHKNYVKTWKSHLLNKMFLDYLWIGKLLKTLTIHRFIHRWLIYCLIL